MKQRIAIIGAGISGLTLAQSLKEVAEVTVFEKARGGGGRMSTRYADPFYFDHGAQFFTARSKEFKHFVMPLITEGLIAPWEGKVITFQEDRTVKDRLWFEPHYVAVPHMNSLCKHMMNGIEVVLSTEVKPLDAKTPEGWHLMDKDGRSLGIYDWVISTAPPVQTQRLFSMQLNEENAFPQTALLGCYTLMVGFDAPWKKPWMAAKVHASPIEWIAVNSTKPERNVSVTSIVVHSSNAWAEKHIDDAMDEAELFLRAEFESVSGIDTQHAAYFSCHRWRYAITSDPKPREPWIDSVSGIASTGDWYTASRVEDAWLNAMKLSKILKRFIDTATASCLDFE